MTADRSNFRVWDGEKFLYTTPGLATPNGDDGPLWWGIVVKLTELPGEAGSLFFEQSTGLTDKSGKIEIFEGDIVRPSPKNARKYGVVEWGNQDGWFGCDSYDVGAS
jgi:hypothetical protein